MGKKLLIIGAGVYGLIVKETAESMQCFEEIAFVDDVATSALDGSPIIGKLANLHQISADFSHIIVAIGNPEIRSSLINKAQSETSCELATIISPLAYIAPSAKIAPGCIIEPMAVIHSKCVLEKGCIVSASAVLNHCVHLCEMVHVDCNAIVAGFQTVPRSKKVLCGTIFE
jgi:UDP-3-O-[3-hydroxymyristoyl] glucosamine N-acyltransferase